ncbi:Indole-3-pyruvate monooxygenase [Bertholletia excelsa]
MAQGAVVLIIGAGPAGIAVSACLNRLSIPNMLLEREDCYASLWKKRTYDRLKLHLAKQFCELPHMPFPPGEATFMPKKNFLAYLDDYVSRFNVKPSYGRLVESASYDGVAKKWRVVAKNVVSDQIEVYVSEFLVVASGENSLGFIPNLLGLEGFRGEVLHSCEYGNGDKFRDKDVLVIGSGNSGMEIAFDLSDWGARTSIVVRNPVHVVTKEMVHLGMALLNYFPLHIVDDLTVFLSNLKIGDLSNFGLQRPAEGPFYLKVKEGTSPIIDVGTIDKIKRGEIQASVRRFKDGKSIEFANGETKKFDAIVFATGYRSTVRRWLKGDDGDLFGKDGMPKRAPPNHWKGDKGLYCAGFARAGLAGISDDAKNIAESIHMILFPQTKT